MEKRIAIAGGELAVFVEGRGEPVIFLHGGPGDTHHYMRRMAKPLFAADQSALKTRGGYRCIFFDQRGTGGSKVDQRRRENFQMDVLFDDLERVRKKFTDGPIRLVGHSWGAMYGLYACMNAPERFSHAALLNMGPLDSEMEKLCGEALLEAMGPVDHQNWRDLRAIRNAARDSKDVAKVEDCDRQMMKLRVKSWIFDPKLHDTFLVDYFQDPPPDREVNKMI